MTARKRLHEPRSRAAAAAAAAASKHRSDGVAAKGLRATFLVRHGMQKVARGSLAVLLLIQGCAPVKYWNARLLFN
jgi:hypothetical protein